jgi:hypothetical protein
MSASPPPGVAPVSSVSSSGPGVASAVSSSGPGVASAPARAAAPRRARWRGRRAPDEWTRPMPLHVTLRMAPHVYSLRSRCSFRVIEAALRVSGDVSIDSPALSSPRGRAGERVPRRRGSEARGVPQRSGAKRHEAGLTGGDSTAIAGLRPGRRLRSREARGRAPMRPGPRGNPERSARADHAPTWARAIYASGSAGESTAPARITRRRGRARSMRAPMRAGPRGKHGARADHAPTWAHGIYAPQAFLH